MLHILILLQFIQENNYYTNLASKDPHPLVTQHGKLRYSNRQFTRYHYNQGVCILISSMILLILTAHVERVAVDRHSDADTFRMTTEFSPPPREIFTRPAPRDRCTSFITSDQSLSTRCSRSPLCGFRRITVPILRRRNMALLHLLDQKRTMRPSCPLQTLSSYRR